MFLSKESVKNTWRQCDAVCLDVDSTVIMDEGLDELAKYLGKGEEVAALTAKAMGGSMTFRQALKTRLDLLQPNSSSVEELADTEGAFTLTPGIKELVSILHGNGVDVFLVSGGFRSLIRPVAKELNIPMNKVFANRLLFNTDGSYAGFDENQPTSASGGKPLVVRQIRAENQYETIVCIGDGVTDMESCPPADAFIGFGGNVVRETVRTKSAWFVYSFQELIDEYYNYSTNDSS